MVEAQMAKLECRVISPTDTLLQLKTDNVTTQASQLKMHTQQCALSKAHFVASRPPPNVVEVIKTRLRTDLKRVSATQLYHGNSLKAVAEVFDKKNVLENKSVQNEAAIRYAICNPLITMVCACFSYSLKLEETIKESLEEGEVDETEAVLVDLRTLWPPTQLEVETESLSPTSTSAQETDLGSGRRSIGGAMSQAHKANYSIYTLVGAAQTHTKLVAIIDAKKHMTPHATAQVIGYYSAFDIGDPRPLVLMMTGDAFKIIIFPFKDQDCHYVNALELLEFKVWKPNDMGPPSFNWLAPSDN